VKLLWREDEVIDQMPFSEGFVVAAVPVLVVDFKEEQFDVALRTQKNRSGAVLADRDAVILEVLSCIE
jgi:hypothetical protein